MDENTLPVIADGENKGSSFINCLRNSYRHLKKFAKRTKTNCFRLYDCEIAAFPIAIDFYAGKFCIHYYSKQDDQDEPSDALQQEVNNALDTLFKIDSSNIFWRTRAKTKMMRQYEKTGNEKEFFVVYEYGVKFLVNLTDYLDTGLFLDHRETRQIVAKQAKGKRVLNLFAYTASFSVHAAVQGALFTKSVDLSNTYTAWAKSNFKLNGLKAEDNAVLRDDCLKFLDSEARSNNRYDLIVIDPPTISRSKKMEKLFDIQVEYKDLILKTLKLLNPEGKIFFSTNSRKFKFDPDIFTNARVLEISHKTRPIDFHDPKIHRCWVIES